MTFRVRFQEDGKNISVDLGDFKEAVAEIKKRFPRARPCEPLETYHGFRISFRVGVKVMATIDLVKASRCAYSGPLGSDRLRCERCDHRWFPRSRRPPERCPKCKSRCWGSQPPPPGKYYEEMTEEDRNFLNDPDQLSRSARRRLLAYSQFPIFVEIVRRTEEYYDLVRRRLMFEEVDRLFIDPTIRCDFDAHWALNLGVPPDAFDGRWPFFDKAGCRTCEKPGHRRYEHEEADCCDFCVDRECYSEKLNKALAEKQLRQVAEIRKEAQ